MVASRKGPRVAIVGGGIGGTAVAAFLQQSGFSPVVYEQSRELREVGAGVVLAPNAVRPLRRMGAMERLRDRAVALDIGWEFRRWQDGRVLSSEDLATSCKRMFGERTYTVHRADLFDAILSTLEEGTVRLGRRCIGLRVHDEVAVLEFEDGTTEEADVVIGADGVHSTVRSAVTIQSPATYSGMCAFRAIVPADRAPDFALRPAQTLWIGPDHHLVHYPISGSAVVNLVAFAPAGDYTVESWSATTTVEEFLAEFEGWDPRLQELIERAGVPGRWALLDREPLERWSRGPVTLLGDAAHPMFPFFAQGAAQAIEDAAVLAACLDDEAHAPARALERYAALRIERATRLQRDSHERARVNHLPDGPGQQARDAALANADPLAANAWIYSYDAHAAVASAAKTALPGLRLDEPVAAQSSPADRPTTAKPRGTIHMSAGRPLASLQDLIDATPNLVDYLYNDTPGPHSRVRADLTPVPAEFTNWRDEQRAWRESAILFDQSHHMPELYVKGPDAFALLNSIGVNSLANLNPGVAKQFVGCNSRGQVIGDCVLYDLGDDIYELVSSKPLLKWVEYQATTGDWDVTLERDENTSDNPDGRRKFRFQIDGPAGYDIFDEVVEGETPEIKFFRTARVRIAGVDVLVLRHGMAGHKGVEISGDIEHGEKVRAAIIEAGEKYGLRQGGTKAYFSTLYEQAWIAYPLPAIYTGDDLKAYREWLPADGWEGKFSLAGSFRSTDIEDYYTTPYDLGYGHIVKFDHDFIGREALEAMAEKPRRKKICLVWNTEDIMRIHGSLFEPGTPYKYMDLPIADYGNMQHRDEVRTVDGALIGLSTYTGYTSNERKIISLALMDAEYANPGEEVLITWGEPDGGSRKPRVELHQQTQVRATIAPAPYASAVQQMMKSAVGPTK